MMNEAVESSNSTKTTTETGRRSRINENSSAREEEQQQEEAGGESFSDRFKYVLFRWQQERMKALSNKQLCRQYDQQIIRSGGFDLGDGRFGCTGLIYEGFSDMVYRLKEDPDLKDMVCSYSKLAISQYNRDKNTNYQYVVFVKGVDRLVNGYIYYLTFEAKEPSDDAPTTFQAAVRMAFPATNEDGTENVLVLLVRKKSCATILDNRVLLGCSN